MSTPNHLRASDYNVQPVSQAMARELVSANHYAGGGPNTGVYRHGLFANDDPITCLGVAWWLPPTKPAALSVHPEWRRVLSLTRLVIVPEMPTNAASYLLGRSIRLIRRQGDWDHLVTYADEGQGHTGAIYRASNWDYAGTRPGDPVWTNEHGRQVSRKAGPKTRTSAEMTALGYTNTGRTRKHKFVLHLRDTPAQTPADQEEAAA